LYTYIKTHSLCDLDNPAALDLAADKNGKITYLVAFPGIGTGIGFQGCFGIEGHYNGRSVTTKNLKAAFG
jgi:hypothetical protein